eukprot:g18748.t1
MLDELIEMDMEKAVQSEADPLANSKVAEDRLCRSQIWPYGFGSEASQAAQAIEEDKNKNIGKRSARDVEQGDSRGVQRAEMKATLFYVLDRDGDGFLYDTELRPFADKFGFEGSASEWAEEHLWPAHIFVSVLLLTTVNSCDLYQTLCNEYRCSPMQGMDMVAFARMLDDEHGCPLSDAELAGLLRESNQLPRAGS